MAFCLTRLSATQGCAIVRNGLEWVGLALCARRTSKTLDMQTGYNDDANVCVYMHTMYTYRLYKSIYIYTVLYTHTYHIHARVHLGRCGGGLRIEGCRLQSTSRSVESVGLRVLRPRGSGFRV